MLTREEAIKTLKENLCGLCAYGSQSMELCDIRSCDNRDAIKALEQEFCEDCISREAAIDILKNMCSVISPLSDDVILIDKAEAMAKLVFLPTVTPEQKTDVLDKIKAEINKLSPEPTAEDVVDGNEVKDAIWEILIEVDKIIDRYTKDGE